MKRIIFKTWASGVAIIAAVQIAQAQTTPAPVNITTTAVPFLRINPDTRAGGMGDASLATPADANSPFNNLSKTVFITSPTNIQATANYSPYLRDLTEDMYHISAAGTYHMDENSAFSASLRYFSMGNVTVNDYNGMELPTSHPNEFSFDFGYARKLDPRFSLAVAFRYINSNLFSGQSIGGQSYKTGSTIAGDITAYYNGQSAEGEGITLGLGLTNLGGKISYVENSNEKAYIPTNLGVGAAYTTVPSENNRLTFAIDVNKLLVPSVPNDPNEIEAYYNQGVLEGWTKSFSNSNFTGNFGAEYSYKDMFMLRAGYIAAPKSQGLSSGATFGRGFRFDSFGMNVSYMAASGSVVTRNLLSNTLRLGLVLDFGRSK
jgi:hypothetical protein